jgi:hypothetical protein
VQLADHVLVRGSTDCGKALGTTGAIILTTQSDIDTISDCTEIFSAVFVQLQSSSFESTDNSSPESPVVLTLPSNLQTIDGALTITVLDEECPTTTVVFPNLQTVGNNSGAELAIQGPRLETWNLTNTSFPALTAVGGSFTYQTGPFLTGVVTGFPILATIGETLIRGVRAGELLINGSFSNIEFPALEAVGGEIIITSTDSSFKCASNLTPKLVTYPNCVVCQYVLAPLDLICGGPPGSTASVTAIGTNIPGTTPTATGKTSSAATGKASGASTFNRAGNQPYQMGPNFKESSIYVTALLCYWLFRSLLI